MCSQYYVLYALCTNNINCIFRYVNKLCTITSEMSDDYFTSHVFGGSLWGTGLMLDVGL
jgi:hypothetical protein